jgi:TolA-binding protein
MNFRFSKVWMILLLAPALFAQEELSTRQIEAALEDELYPLAEQQIWEALSTERTPDDEATLTIFLIRTLTGEHKFDEAVILADESSDLPQQDAFAYWRARALFEAGNFDGVSQTLEKNEKRLSKGTFAAAALRLKGRAVQASGDLKAAQKTFEAFRKQFPDDEDAAQNLLDLAGIYLERGKNSDSSKALHELLERFPDSALAATTRLELARQLIASGGKDELKEASVLLSALGSSETANARLRSTAWVELSSIERRAGNAAAATDALAQAEKLTDDAVLRARQKAARANLLMEENKTKEAFPLFDEAVKESPDTSTAAEILVQKAEALLKTEQYPEAEKVFQASLDITSGNRSAMKRRQSPLKTHRPNAHSPIAAQPISSKRAMRDWRADSTKKP